MNPNRDDHKFAIIAAVVIVILTIILIATYPKLKALGAEEHDAPIVTVVDNRDDAQKIGDRLANFSRQLEEARGTIVYNKITEMDALQVASAARSDIADLENLETKIINSIEKLQKQLIE